MMISIAPIPEASLHQRLWFPISDLNVSHSCPLYLDIFRGRWFTREFSWLLSLRIWFRLVPHSIDSSEFSFDTVWSIPKPQRHVDEQLLFLTPQGCRECRRGKTPAFRGGRSNSPNALAFHVQGDWNILSRLHTYGSNSCSVAHSSLSVPILTVPILIHAYHFSVFQINNSNPRNGQLHSRIAGSCCLEISFVSK